MKTKLILISTLICIWLVSMTAYTQNMTLAVASDNAGSLQYETGTGDYIELGKLDSINYIAWNNDGTKLGFIRHISVPNDNDVREIGFVEFDSDGKPESTPMILQTHRPTFGYNLAWTDDDRILFVTENPEVDPETGLHRQLDIMSVTLGDESQVLGTFTPQDGCGGGSPFPADWRYGIEMNGSLGGFFLTLSETPYGILYTSECSGTTQMLLNPTTGESTLVAKDFAKAVVSPDGEQVAGVQFQAPNWETSSLMIYNLVDGTSQVIPTNDTPDLIAWGQDGTSIYYTVRTKERNLLQDYSGDERAILDVELRHLAGEVPSYRVALYHIDLNSMGETLVYQGDHFAIGRVFDTSMGVFISVIPNLDMWVSMIANRQMAPADEQAGLSTVEVGTFQIEHLDDNFGEPVLWGFYELFTPFVR